MVTQAPQYTLTSLGALRNIPISSASGSAKSTHPEILGDIASTSRGAGLALVSHYDIQRVVDIFGSVQGRDLGAVGRDITKIVDENRKKLPRGMKLIVRGQYQTMQDSFMGLLGGLVLAIVLVYGADRDQFPNRGWIRSSFLPRCPRLSARGIVLFLFATHDD